jgi:hypothetical protein
MEHLLHRELYGEDCPEAWNVSVAFLTGAAFTKTTTAVNLQRESEM